MQHKSNFIQLHEVLPHVVRRFKLDRQVTGAVMCAHFRKAIDAVWKGEAAEYVKPQHFKDGVLTVTVVNSGWAQEVQFKRVALLDHLKKACPTPAVKRMQVRVGAFEADSP